MTLKIEGYDLNQLAQLGKNVETVDTRHLSISGDAQYVAQVYMALGLFAPVVAELKKHAPADDAPITKLSREQEEARIRLGISESEALEMANSGKQPPAVASIAPSELLPFGLLLPKDGEAREHAVKHLRWVLHEVCKGIVRRPNPTYKKFASWNLALYEALSKVLNQTEMAYLFPDSEVENAE